MQSKLEYLADRSLRGSSQSRLVSVIIGLVAIFLATGTAFAQDATDKAEEPPKERIALSPKKPLAGEKVTVTATFDGLDGGRVHLYLGTGDGTSNVTVDGTPTPLPFTTAKRLAVIDAKGETASFSFTVPDDDTYVGKPLQVAAAVASDGKIRVATKSTTEDPIRRVAVTKPLGVLAILLLVLAVLFTMNRSAKWGKIFKIIPLLVFAYFVPTLLSNTGIIPLDSPLYTFIKKVLLPASLVLLTLAVDIPAVLRLGRPALILFATATLSIVIGGPIAYLLFGAIGLIPESLGDQAWRGLAALSGSWIGGGANFVGIGESVGASDSTISLMVVVDVAIANIWMAALLYFSGREKEMDAKIGADRAAVDDCRERVEQFQAQVSRPTNLPDLLAMLGIALGTTAVATWLSTILPPLGQVVNAFTWLVLISTAIGVTLSFTKLRRLDGSGASAVGSVFLYLLVASIGAHAEFHRVLDPDNIKLVLLGALWMAFHASSIMIVRRIIKAPIFFAAVGSQANVGGAASAPVVAASFHPALAPAGVLLAVLGYAVGTYAGLACAFLLEMAHNVVG